MCCVIYRLYFIVLISFALSCNISPGKKNSEVPRKSEASKSGSSFDNSSESINTNIIPYYSNEPFLYDLDYPDEKYLLPDYLKEISGIVYFKENRILCEQDEKADIYVFDLDKKEIVNKYSFGSDGDYEDIAVIDKTVYMLRSDGQIFEVKNFEKENRKVEKLKTGLSTKNNTEGLAYDKSSNSLLIACKDSPSVKNGDTYKGYKAIYKFDLGNLKLDTEPFILVDLKRNDSYKNVNMFKKYSLMVAGKRRSMEWDSGFKPSGIAIHPIYNEIYLIASVGKILIILDTDGKVLDLQNLNSRIFRQPEGICFSPEGDLYISSEGAGGKGYILKFKLQTRK
jgi:uncharacterized protein YjiK